MKRVVVIRSLSSGVLGLAFAASGVAGFFYDGPWRGHQPPPSAVFMALIAVGVVVAMRGALGSRVERDGDVVRVRARAWHFGLRNTRELACSDIDIVRVTIEKHTKRPGHPAADTYGLEIVAKSGETIPVPASFFDSGAAVRIQLAIEALLRP